MFKLQPFCININRRAISGSDSKSKDSVVSVDSSILYSKFLIDKFFYQEMYDEDYGNNKMRRLNLEELYVNVVSLELLASHMLSIMSQSLKRIKELEELGTSRQAFEEALTRNGELLKKYEDTSGLPLCLSRYVTQYNLKFNNLLSLNLVFI